MKSELRTELKSNLLADRLEEAVLAVKPHLKLIGFSLAALTAVGIVYGFMHSMSEKASANAWSELYFAGNGSEKLNEVYQDFPSTSAGLWAKQKTADALTARALEQVYVDRDLSDKLLEEAAQAYRSVLSKAQEPMLVCRATYGLAQVLDSQGNATEAAREFKKVLTLPGSHADMIADSQRRLEFIDSEEGRTFYTWFKNSRPTAPKPVDIPKDLGNLPSQPDLKFSTPPVPSVPASSSESTTPTESKSSDSGAALKMPTDEKAPAETAAVEKSTIVEPPAKPPALEPPVEPKADENKADEPKAKVPAKGKSKKKKDAEPAKSESPKNEEALKIPDAELSTSEKKAGGS